MDVFFQILRWVIIGGVAGYVASLVLRAERQGCLINIAIGVVGAFVGGFIFGQVLNHLRITGVTFIDTIIHATVGSAVLLIVAELLLPGRQLGTRGEKKKRRRRRRR